MPLFSLQPIYSELKVVPYKVLHDLASLGTNFCLKVSALAVLSAWNILPQTSESLAPSFFSFRLFFAMLSKLHTVFTYATLYPPSVFFLHSIYPSPAYSVFNLHNF